MDTIENMEILDSTKRRHIRNEAYRAYLARPIYCYTKACPDKNYRPVKSNENKLIAKIN